MRVPLEPSDLRRFQERPWALVRALKAQHWAEHARAQPAETGLRVGEQLWIHARSVDPQWPREADRRSDLEHHIDLATRLCRAAHAFRR